jgi:hypothetical protein
VLTPKPSPHTHSQKNTTNDMAGKTEDVPVIRDTQVHACWGSSAVTLPKKPHRRHIAGVHPLPCGRWLAARPAAHPAQGRWQVYTHMYLCIGEAWQGSTTREAQHGAPTCVQSGAMQVSGGAPDADLVPDKAQMEQERKSTPYEGQGTHRRVVAAGQVPGHTRWCRSGLRDRIPPRCGGWLGSSSRQVLRWWPTQGGRQCVSLLPPQPSLVAAKDTIMTREFLLRRAGAASGNRHFAVQRLAMC